MKSHRFANGDELPLLGLGTWKSEPGEVGAAVKEAIRLGYRHFDCSPIYGNEIDVGRALSECLSEGLVTRDELWITSKLWNDAHAPEDVRPALEKTLDDLRLEYLDLYLIHWPIVQRRGSSLPEHGSDFISLDDLPTEVTWRELERAADEGLCRHLGVSNFSAVKLAALLDVARVAPEANQVELHPYLQQNELLAFCRSHDILMTAYSPLGSFDRPDRLKHENEPNIMQDPRIGEVANRHGATPPQVLIAWAIGRGTAVIPKSVNPGRLAENLAAASLDLDEDEMRQIAALDRRRRYISGEFWEREGSPYRVAELWDEMPDGTPIAP